MYSKTTRQLTKKDIIKVVSRRATRTLTKQEETIIEQTILQTRGKNESVSLFEIDEALKQLEHSKKIDKFDRSGVMKQFKTLFEK